MNNKWFCKEHYKNQGRLTTERMLCDVCSCKGINKCECGGTARYFGEALMGSVRCDDCDQFVMQIGNPSSVVDLWNNGVRGCLESTD